jgi:hypothetical protein
MPQPADFGGFLYDPTQLSQRNIPTVTQTFHELQTLSYILAELGTRALTLAR